ncbi:MAG: hypothetical protein JWQ07_3128 [Ramlibacter sp.]|nr:hypothetical protein [Ramlibacter sp.]
MGLRFEWDSAKAAANLRKHGVSFELAMHVFADPLAFSRQDRIEDGEQRWQTLGVVDGLLLLLVAHTVREDDDGEVTRIISARQATRKEKRDYEQENG